MRNMLVVHMKNMKYEKQVCKCQLISKGHAGTTYEEYEI